MRAISSLSPCLLTLPAVAALALSAPALAQSASDFRLQPGAGRPAPGPVDPDNPAAPVRPAPAPTAATTVAPPSPPTPTPTPTLSIPPATATRSGSAPAMGPPAPASAKPIEAATPTAAPPTAPIAAPSAAPAQAEPELAPPTALPPRAEQPAAPETTTATIAWWWLLPAALLGALAALAGWAVMARSRGRQAPEPDFIRPRPVDSAVLPRPPAPQPQPAASPPAAAAEPLEFLLEPLRFSVTLVNATLQYRLTLANRSAATLGPIYIAADMIAAHASLPEASQLAQDGAGLELRHEVAALGQGETVELKGDLRLPLAAVTPIRAGNASLLVPLVRLRVEGAGPSRTTALVVGEPPVTPGGPLRPFRLDQGPRIFAAVSQRALAA